MGVFEHFPYTNFHDLNLDWVVQLIRKLDGNVEDLDKWAAQHEIDYKDLATKVEGLINHLVDAIMPWDSSVEYLIYSIVSWEGSNYIAIQDVPVGVMITNTDYWVESNTLVEQLNAISIVTSEIRKENIRHFDIVADMLAEESLADGAYARTGGYYSVNDGGGALYQIDETAGSTPETLELTNGLYAHIIPDDPEICCVDQLGAVGDGVADDTVVINHCLETYRVTKLGCNKTYLISNTLTVPYGHSIDGQNAMIRTVPVADFTAHGVVGLPAKIAMFVQGREPVAGTELQGYTRYIKGFRLVEGGTLNDLTGSADFVGIYAGYKTPLSGIGSKVNNAVYAYTFERIYIHGFETSFYEAEVWQGKFIGVELRNFKTTGFKIFGQSVNNYYVDCNVDGRGTDGTTGIEFNVSPNYNNRPEGHMFSSCGIFACDRNIRQWTGLSIQFGNCMIDLANKYAIVLIIGDLFVNNSWIACRYGGDSLTTPFQSPAIYLDNVATPSAGNKATITNCSIVNANQNGGQEPFAVAQGFGRYADIISNCKCSGNVRQVNTAAAMFIYNNSFNTGNSIYTMGNGKRSGNYFAIDGSELT